MHIKVDYRSYVTTIRNLARKTGEKIKSINDNPNIKTDIYTDIYRSGYVFDIPVYTGALKESPFSPTPQAYKKGKYTNYAYGDIDSNGIHFDPFSYVLDSSGNIVEENHYVDKLVEEGKFHPHYDLNTHRDEVLFYVAEHIVEELKHG